MDEESNTMASSPSIHELGYIETYKQEFEVERILWREWRNQWPYYLIKWKGWTNKWNTWEPVHHMLNSIDTVISYEEGIAKGVRCGSSWLPKGEKWKLKIPVMRASDEAFLKFVRECVNAERKILIEAEEVQSHPTDSPTPRSGDCSAVIHPELALPVPTDTIYYDLTSPVEVSSKDLSGVHQPVGVISAGNFDIYNEDTQFLDLASHGTSAPSVPSKGILECQNTESDTCGIKSACGGTLASNFTSSSLSWLQTASITKCGGESGSPDFRFASSLLPCLQTASNMKCGGESAAVTQAQVSLSSEHSRRSTLDLTVEETDGQVVIPSTDASNSVQKTEGFPVYIQKKSCRRRCQWRKNFRRRTAEAKSLMLKAYES